MGDKEEKLWQWVDSVLHYEPISWDRLPELDLYMDQVITLMSKELDPFSLEGERLLTPSMINNYVKDGVLPRPNQKKYGREHLSRLLMICTLKSVLSLPEIDSTLRGLTEVQPIRDLYQDFADAQNIALKEVAERVGRPFRPRRGNRCISSPLGWPSKPTQDGSPPPGFSTAWRRIRPPKARNPASPAKRKATPPDPFIEKETRL